MTLKQAKTAVKALGYQLDYDADLDEYTVYTHYNARDAYYTHDREDAVGTAKAMALARTELERT